MWQLALDITKVRVWTSDLKWVSQGGRKGGKERGWKTAMEGGERRWQGGRQKGEGVKEGTKRGRLETECAGGVRAAGMSHLSPQPEPRASVIGSLFIEKGGKKRETILQQVIWPRSMRTHAELTSRFSGLMSLCTMLRLWRYLMALARL